MRWTFLFTAGVLVLLASLGWSLRVAGFEANTVRTLGTVTAIRAVQDLPGPHPNSLMYFPVVEYLPEGSETALEVTGVIGSNQPGYSEGDSVGVRYLPAQPERAVLDDPWALWAGPALVAAIGLGLCMLGSIPLWSRSKKPLQRAQA